MLPTGYHWHDADGPNTPGWWQLLNEAGQVVAQIQPSDGRHYITVGLDGYAHAVRTGSTSSLERAKMHVERWAGERG